MSLWAFRFILWHLCIYLVQPQHRLPWMIPLHPGDLTFFMAFGLHFVDCMMNGKSLIRFGAATKFAIALLVLATLANAFGAYQISPSWNVNYAGIVKNSLVLILLEATITSPHRAFAVLMTVAACSLWWFKAGVRGIQAGGTFQDARIMGPNVGLVQGPNEFGIFMVVIVALCLGLYYIAERKSWLKWVFLALALTGIFVVLQTGSRAGLLGLGLLGILFIPRLFKTRITGMILIPIVVYFAVTGIDEKNLERFKTIEDAIRSQITGTAAKPYSEMNQDEKSAEDRRMKNVDTWKLIKANPILGAGLWPNTGLIPYEHARGTVHNELLMAGRQMGMPGMILMLSMYSWVIWVGTRVYSQTKNNWHEVSMMAWCCRTMSILLFFGGLFSTFAWNMLLMALMASTSQLQKFSKENRLDR